MHLDEIMLANTPACFEPSLDYVVTKIPRFPFDKFTLASNKLSTQMKATGEVMSVGRTMEESLLKAIRSLESGQSHLHMPKFDSENMTTDELLAYVRSGTDDRIYAIAQLMWKGVDHSRICNITQIDLFFLDKIKLDGFYLIHYAGIKSIYKHQYDGNDDLFIEDCIRAFKYDFGIEPNGD